MKKTSIILCFVSVFVAQAIYADTQQDILNAISVPSSGLVVPAWHWVDKDGVIHLDNEQTLNVSSLGSTVQRSFQSLISSGMSANNALVRSLQENGIFYGNSTNLLKNIYDSLYFEGDSGTSAQPWLSVIRNENNLWREENEKPFYNSFSSYLSIWTNSWWKVPSSIKVPTSTKWAAMAVRDSKFGPIYITDNSQLSITYRDFFSYLDHYLIYYEKLFTSLNNWQCLLYSSDTNFYNFVQSKYNSWDSFYNLYTNEYLRSFFTQDGFSVDDSTLMRSWIKTSDGSLVHTPAISIKGSFESLVNSIVDYIPNSLSSLNNYLYDFSYNRFPVLTNQVDSLTTSTTNFFSFFRNTTEGYGVLSDYDSHYGSYHDFLTNYYVQASTGNISPGFTDKTNWFYRVEALLASLVFADAPVTNTVDSSSAQNQASSLTGQFTTINTTASTFSQEFNETSRGIVYLYTSFFNAFSEAALPRSVALVQIPSDDGNTIISIDISSNDSLATFFEGARLITTFCWASVGIFALYKFLVWSARCIIVACVFLYRVVGGIFHKA